MRRIGRTKKIKGSDVHSPDEYSHPNIWQREEFKDWARLVIGARDGEIPLILDLCREMNGPFGVLYVLTLSLNGHGECRYQNPTPIEFDELHTFSTNFRAFIEQDGRHNFWVMSTSGEGQFIFDKHNMIYAYGDLARYEVHLKSAGFSLGVVGIPSPHAPAYHREFVPTHDELMDYWDWVKFPLKPEDDD